jgi:hypothetical protein
MSRTRDPAMRRRRPRAPTAPGEAPASRPARGRSAPRPLPAAGSIQVHQGRLASQTERTNGPGGLPSQRPPPSTRRCRIP